MTMIARQQLAGMAVGAVLMLGGCGGGGGGDTPAPKPQGQVATEVPVAATASVASYTEFVGSQPEAEAAEPLSVETVAMAPVSETDDPVEVN